MEFFFFVSKVIYFAKGIIKHLCLILMNQKKGNVISVGISNYPPYPVICPKCKQPFSDSPQASAPQKNPSKKSPTPSKTESKNTNDSKKALAKTLTLQNNQNIVMSDQLQDQKPREIKQMQISKSKLPMQILELKLKRKKNLKLILIIQ